MPPWCGDSEANNILHSFVELAGLFPQQMAQYQPQILQVLVVTLSPSEREWRQWGIAEDVAQSLVILFVNLMSQSQQGHAIVNQILGDEQGRSEMLQQRVQNIQATLGGSA